MGCGGTLVVFRIGGTVAAPLRFGADFELDPRAYQLRRAGRPLRLERIPMELLLLLVAQRGQLVTREQIIEAVWGKDVFVDVDASINSAVRKIRQVLKDDAERPRFLQTVTGRGYRFIAPVLEDEPAPAIEAGGQDLPAPQTPAPQHRRTLRVGALVALGAALVIALGLVARAVFTGPPVTIRSIAVLPLENLTGDGAQDYFTDGMTDALTTTLAQIESLRVISRTSAMRYRDSRKAVPEIARELGVDAVVAGSVARSGDRVRINAQLIEASRDRHRWAESYERPIEDVLALQGEMARTIASEIELRLTPQQEGRLKNPRPVTPQAYEAYLKGRFFWNKRNKEAIEKSIDYYTEAIRLDPGYAPAYAGLAEAYTVTSCGAPAGLSTRESAPKARSAAVKAVELDDGSAEAHAALGFQENCYGDMAAAEREYRRAIALNPNYAAAHHWYAVLLLGWRDQEALEHVKEALRLDPVSPNINGLLGNVLMNLRRFDEAVEQIRQTVELDPQQYNSRMRLGYAYAVTGRYGEAEREFSAADAISPGTVYTLGARAYLSGLQGKKTTAESLLPELEAKALEAGHPWLVSLAHIGLGRKDEAIEWLEKAYDQGDFYFDLMNPVVDSLRAERRFKDLERRVQLARQAHALR